MHPKKALVKADFVATVGRFFPVTLAGDVLSMPHCIVQNFTAE